MQHSIAVDDLSQTIGPLAHGMVHAIETCVHCGFCLPVCPTYQVLGEEMDSPRGRIVLMKSVLEGTLTYQETLPYIDRCLGCLACVTACPSGVAYSELLAPFRLMAQQRTKRPLADKVRRTLLQNTLPYPGRFLAAAKLGNLAKPIKGWLPESWQRLLALLPDHLSPMRPLPPLTPAIGLRRARVALLIGCVQQALAPEINWVTLRVLAINGVEVIISAGQGCCGAISMHSGYRAQALRLARQNLTVFPDDVDVILTNAAGCGSGMKNYPLLFAGQPDQVLTERFTHRVQDVSEFLANLGLMTPPALAQPLKLAYHDACHLSNVQGITDAPRKLLSAIPNLTLLEVSDGGTCCGSAGTYNLEQPEIASELGRRKVQNILKTGAEAVAAGNIGCLVQIRKYLQAAGKPLPVYHTMEVLDQAYDNHLPP